MRRAEVMPVFGGFILAALTVLLSIFLPSHLALEWLAIILGVVAAVYLGFALVDGRKRELITEIAFAVFTLALALIGLWSTPLLLALGYVFHGIWDLLHLYRHPLVQTRLPWWYVFFCVSFDWPVAAYIFVRW